LEHFYRAQKNLSSLHKIGWRPAEKNSPVLFCCVLDLDFYGHSNPKNPKILSGTVDENLSSFSRIRKVALVCFVAHFVLILVYLDI
jgi:hypothetical protein